VAPIRPAQRDDGDSPVAFIGDGVHGGSSSPPGWPVVLWEGKGAAQAQLSPQRRKGSAKDAKVSPAKAGARPLLRHAPSLPPLIPAKAGTQAGGCNALSATGFLEPRTTPTTRTALRRTRIDAKRPEE